MSCPEESRNHLTDALSPRPSLWLPLLFMLPLAPLCFHPTLSSVVWPITTISVSTLLLEEGWGPAGSTVQGLIPMTSFLESCELVVNHSSPQNLLMCMYRVRVAFLFPLPSSLGVMDRSEVPRPKCITLFFTQTCLRPKGILCLRVILYFPQTVLKLLVLDLQFHDSLQIIPLVIPLHSYKSWLCLRGILIPSTHSLGLKGTVH